MRRFGVFDGQIDVGLGSVVWATCVTNAYLTASSTAIDVLGLLMP